MGGCSITGIMDESGRRFAGDTIIRSIRNMHERSNGLGGGFAAYGIYPERDEQYAMHLMFDTHQAKRDTEALLDQRATVHLAEPIPTRAHPAISGEPILHRYFVNIEADRGRPHLGEDDLVVELHMQINAEVEDAFVFSAGKNMGCFKGVGYPEDIGEFFRLEEYDAYIWIAHGRFPTNTTGWWGGAHPFSLLDWAIVHNGEISSYGINKRYLRNFGYECTLQTDTEVIAYMFDLLMRKHGLPLELACSAMAPPFWNEIERMDEVEQAQARAIRAVYGGALLNGPFAVVVGSTGRMIGFSDRTKLRPQVCARSGDRLYISSEEAAIRTVCPDPDVVWHPEAGEPVLGELQAGVKVN
ncbi:MAG: glutamine amidotransferase family protein [candidate division WS1 bacterium]|jgi:glutamate synthase domain-containing protein 1|nr:glutamine amidotransferase family protein [candidate division WS1 bacterium]